MTSLLSVNGQPVHTGTDLVNPIAQTPIGHSVKLSYVRNKQASDVTLTVADRSQLFPQTAQDADQAPDQGDQADKFGLHVEDLTADLAHKIGMGKLVGAVVTEVEPASFAEDVGFTRGDVIVEVNHVAITSLADYKAQMAKLKPGDDVPLQDRPAPGYRADAVPGRCGAFSAIGETRFLTSWRGALSAPFSSCPSHWVHYLIGSPFARPA